MPVKNGCRLARTVENDPLFDTTKAQKKLRQFVQGQEHAIKLKAEIMVEHFQTQVLAPKKIGGQARAMVVTDGMQRAIQYDYAIKNCLSELQSPYQAIVAFSSAPNDFSSNDIPKKIQQDPYRAPIRMPRLTLS